MNTPPPLMRDQRAADREHLNLLAIFHFLVAGLAIVGIAFLFLHYTILHTIFTNPDIWQPKSPPSGEPAHTVPPVPKEFFSIFKWFYVFFGAALLMASVGNLLSGLFLRARKHRSFSIVIAALDCLQVPFGTVLGVFTIVVLVRESVAELYQSNPP